jgi:hypothetical protein
MEKERSKASAMTGVGGECLLSLIGETHQRSSM